MAELYVLVNVCTEVLRYLSNTELMPMEEIEGFFHQFWDIYALLQLKDCSLSSSDICFFRVSYLNCYCTPWGNPHITAAVGFQKGWRGKQRCLLASALPWPWLSRSRRAPQSSSRSLCLFSKALFSTKACLLACLSARGFEQNTTVINKAMLSVPLISERGSA